MYSCFHLWGSRTNGLEAVCATFAHHSPYPTLSLVTLILINSTDKPPISPLHLALPSNGLVTMNATQAVLDWIAAHPYQTAFHVVNGVIICTPAAATVPFLSAMGFSAAGPVAGRSYSNLCVLSFESIANVLNRLYCGFCHVLVLFRTCWRPLRDSSERSHGRLRGKPCWRCAGSSSADVYRDVVAGTKRDRRMNRRRLMRP